MQAEHAGEGAAPSPQTPQTRATAEVVREFCREQIAHCKVPRRVRFVEDIPMTVTGKAPQYLMRQSMAAELAANTVTASGTDTEAKA